MIPNISLLAWKNLGTPKNVSFVLLSVGLVWSASGPRTAIWRLHCRFLIRRKIKYLHTTYRMNSKVAAQTFESPPITSLRLCIFTVR